MKFIYMYSKKIIITALLIPLMVACSLDVTDPNTATDEEVLNSREGIIAFTTGMQGYVKGTALQAIIRTPAVSTREMAINTTFANLIELEAGGIALPDENASILQIWSRLLRVLDMTSQIIDNADNVQLSGPERSEILAIAHIYKAMALGFLVSNFEQSPISSDETGNAQFFSRAEVLSEAIQLLNDANQVVSATAPTSTFRTQGLDIENTIQAFLARYHLMAGNYDQAITAANTVDPEATSIFFYDGSSSRNPVYDDVFTSEAYAARDNFGSPLAETGDQRIDFFLIDDDAKSSPNELDIAILDGFFGSPSSAIPVYRPGEMVLIRAEAYARTDRPTEAVAEIDFIRTKEPADDPFGLGAGLDAYSGSLDEASLIEEIYRQRSAELYLTGMRMEDARRLDRPAVANSPSLTDERNRNYYPYPIQEQQSNPNTPQNPAI
jgi:starch-binding outer membrane protein, SusD/RagB family